MLGGVDEIRRPDDDELCGFVASCDGGWRALTVFGGELGRHHDRQVAVDRVLSDGLASMADRWTLRHRTAADDEIVCIVEATPAEVTVARGYYATPDVPRLALRRGELESGEWELRRP